MDAAEVNQLLEDNWDNIIKKVINPLWKRTFKEKFRQHRMDEDDFVSLAHEELPKGFLHYNPEKSNIYTFAHNILSRKANSAIRDSSRDVRKAFSTSYSLDVPLSDDDNTEMVDLIEDKMPEEHSLLTMGRVGSFINELSNLQLKILILLLLDFNKEDLEEMIKTPKYRIHDAFKELMSEDLKGILTRRKIS